MNGLLGSCLATVSCYDFIPLCLLLWCLVAKSSCCDAAMLLRYCAVVSLRLYAVMLLRFYVAMLLRSCNVMLFCCYPTMLLRFCGAMLSCRAAYMMWVCCCFAFCSAAMLPGSFVNILWVWLNKMLHCLIAVLICHVAMLLTCYVVMFLTSGVKACIVPPSWHELLHGLGLNCHNLDWISWGAARHGYK